MQTNTSNETQSMSKTLLPSPVAPMELIRIFKVERVAAPKLKKGDLRKSAVNRPKPIVTKTETATRHEALEFSPHRYSLSPLQLKRKQPFTFKRPSIFQQPSFHIFPASNAADSRQLESIKPSNMLQNETQNDSDRELRPQLINMNARQKCQIDRNLLQKVTQLQEEENINEEVKVNQSNIADASVGQPSVDISLPTPQPSSESSPTQPLPSDSKKQPSRPRFYALCCRWQNGANHCQPREKKRRNRLQKSELEFLEAEYLKDSEWNTAKTQELAKHLGHNRIKVYKWHWDRKKRDQESGRDEESAQSSNQ